MAKPINLYGLSVSHFGYQLISAIYPREFITCFYLILFRWPIYTTKPVL
jgi:hypothetical protein